MIDNNNISNTNTNTNHIEYALEKVKDYEATVADIFKKYEKIYNDKFKQNYQFFGSINVEKTSDDYKINVDIIVKFDDNNKTKHYDSKSYIADANKNLLPQYWSYNTKTISLCNIHLINIMDEIDKLI